MGSHVNDLSVRLAMDEIRRIVQSLRESSSAAQSSHGVSSAQLFVLQRLSEQGDATVNQLAARTLTHQSSVSVVVARLEREGLVHRAPSPQDRRSVVVSLTPRGRKLAGRAPDPAQALLLNGLHALTAAERKRLALLLHKLVKAMGLTDAKPAPMFFEDKRR